MQQEKTYAGSIGNVGPQRVQALFPAGKKQGGKVMRGNDLRNGPDKHPKPRKKN